MLALNFYKKDISSYNLKKFVELACLLNLYLKPSEVFALNTTVLGYDQLLKQHLIFGTSSFFNRDSIPVKNRRLFFSSQEFASNSKSSGNNIKDLFANVN